ncbi:hypothetical protein QUA71_06870 [Microcoleus sp. MON1_C5]|uniref:hypothetical protein n=1 Tax=Microcoleus sp. MON1_C5 TaxID=2818828 RepID=UPI002FD4099E
MDDQERAFTDQDIEIKKQITMFAQEFSHQENLTLAINAIQEIDFKNRLCQILPKDEGYSPNLKAAINLLRHLLPRTKAEVAMTILWDVWDIYEMKPIDTSDPPSTLIE